MDPRNPSTWDYGGRSNSPRNSSFSSSLDPADDSPLLDDGTPRASGMTHRRGSVTRRLAALTDIGGYNSIRSFTRSMQRAAAFAEVIPNRPNFVFAPDQTPMGQADAENVQYSRSYVAPPARANTSLIRQQLQAEPEQSSSRETDHPHYADAAADFRERERKALDAELAAGFHLDSTSSSPRRQSIFAIPPHLAVPPIGSYSSYLSYGTLQSDQSRRSSIAQSWHPQQPVPDHEEPLRDEAPPMLVKEVEQDGKIVLTVEGQSTLPQTIFNSINVLIGVGLLSLPLGIRYAGWLCGMVALALCAVVTSYTATLLAKCMDLDPTLITFSDIAFISFGRKARIATSILFTLELMAACVALVVLFADSLDLLFPGLLTSVQWKVLCIVILVPLNFLPLRLLSFTSIIGIVACFGIVMIVVLDGFIKPTAPGSLLDPAVTYMFPERWSTLPLSFGLLLSPWGGHSVFPNIYRDMRHPYKYQKALKVTFSFTYLLDATTAIAGILMFGDNVAEEITSSILRTTGYPRALTLLMCTFIAIIPLTKIPLNARPIVNTLEVLLGLHQPQAFDGPARTGWATFWHGVLTIAVRIVTLLSFLAISILFPAFDTIMAFMGNALCFTICIILPAAFYLKLFYHEISPRERLFAYTLIIVSSILSLIGTVWAFLPKSLIGAD